EVWRPFGRVFETGRLPDIRIILSAAVVLRFACFKERSTPGGNHAKRYWTCVRRGRHRARRGRRPQWSGTRTNEDEARTAAGLSTTIPILARHCCPRQPHH